MTKKKTNKKTAKAALGSRSNGRTINLYPRVRPENHNFVRTMSRKLNLSESAFVDGIIACTRNQLGVATLKKIFSGSKA